MALKKTDQVYIDNYSKNKSTNTSAAKQGTSPAQNIDRYVQRSNLSNRAINAGSNLGLTGTVLENGFTSYADVNKVYNGNPTNLKTMETASNALGGVSKQQYQDSSARDTYLANLKSQLEAQNAAYDQLMAYNQQMYAEQQRQAALQREENARRAYIAKEMALKNMPGQLAREGINGGLAETSRVRLNNRYNRSLSDGDLAYSDAVNKAYLDMVNNNRESVAGKAAAQANYTSGLAKAPAVATKTVKVDTGDVDTFIDSMAQLGYTADEAYTIWQNKRK